MNAETVITLCIIGVATAWLLFRALRRLTSKNPSGCAGCPACGCCGSKGGCSLQKRIESVEPDRQSGSKK